MSQYVIPSRRVFCTALPASHGVMFAADVTCAALLTSQSHVKCVVLHYLHPMTSCVRLRPRIDVTCPVLHCWRHTLSVFCCISCALWRHVCDWCHTRTLRVSSRSAPPLHVPAGWRSTPRRRSCARRCTSWCSPSSCWSSARSAASSTAPLSRPPWTPSRSRSRCSKVRTMSSIHRGRGVGWGE